MHNKPVLVLAPHLTYPTRNGADILIDRRWEAYSSHVPKVDVIGKETISTFRDGRLQHRTSFVNRHRRKIWAALWTILRHSHYLLEKFLTPSYIRVARHHLEDETYGLVVFSYLCTATLYDRSGAKKRPYVIETHNDDFKWFANMGNSTRNPLASYVASLSYKWTKNFLLKHSEDFVFLHVTEQDRQGYNEAAPEHRSLVASIGVDSPEAIPFRIPYDGIPRLLFIGSLNTRMNEDALRHFADNFYSELMFSLDGKLCIAIVGSNPTVSIRHLCSEKKWNLYADVSEEELHYQFSQATCAILPFPYATGAKLKLLNSLAHGVPFLATSSVIIPDELSRFPCLVADNASAWATHIRRLMTESPQQQTGKLLTRIKPYTWKTIAEQLADSLESILPREA